jgi:hypothetical protein
VVVEYTTKTGRSNKGVATTWLKPMIPTDESEVFKVPCFVRRSQFRLPNRPQTPVIMIGPGTGLAPFRGFIQVLFTFAKTGCTEKVLNLCMNKLRRLFLMLALLRRASFFDHFLWPIFLSSLHIHITNYISFMM